MSRTVAAAVTLIVLTSCAGNGTERVVTPPTPAPTTPATTAKTPSTTGATARAPRTTLVPQRWIFPIQPVSAASYGRAHHDYPATDLFAPCGTSVVSPTSGRITEVSTTDIWDPAVNDGATRGGLSVAVVDATGVRYYGSHFSKLDPGVTAGATVEVGDPLGLVGKTGNARSTPCHLHFGLSPACAVGDWEVRRGVIGPADYLDAWKAGTARSPAGELRAWQDANRPLCTGPGIIR